jgi:hypothetical protein
LALKDEKVRTDEVVHDNDKLSDILDLRLKRFQKTSLYKIQYFLAKYRDLDMKEGISLGQVEKQLRRMRIAREIPDNNEVLLMF